MNKIKMIKNAQVVTENGIIWDGAIVISDGKIAQIGREREIETPVGAEVIDAGGAYVGPGFVDIHVHGGGGYSTCYEPKKAAEFFLAHGTTSILATPDYHMNRETLLEVTKNIKAAATDTETLKGIYMECPYTNPRYGSHADLNPWRYGVLPKDYIPLVDEAGDFVKVWSIAPERIDLIPFLEYARKVNPDVIFALGHSEATPMEIRALGKYRPKIQTHSMNATGRRPVYGGTRAYGPDEYTFKEIDIYAELISDSCGIHVHPEMQQLLLHTKGLDRVILITDSTVHENPTPEKYKHVTDLNFDHNGGIAGSKMTMELACRNVMSNTNCGIAQAFKMASTNPARAIGMGDEVGSIEVGKQADFVFVDDKFAVKNVMVRGKFRI
ncbi:MAG: amidohydrolase family protein [Monoglobales bacterium]